MRNFFGKINVALIFSVISLAMSVWTFYQNTYERQRVIVNVLNSPYAPGGPRVDVGCNQKSSIQLVAANTGNRQAMLYQARLFFRRTADVPAGGVSVFSYGGPVEGLPVALKPGDILTFQVTSTAIPCNILYESSADEPSKDQEGMPYKRISMILQVQSMDTRGTFNVYDQEIGYMSVSESKGMGLSIDKDQQAIPNILMNRSLMTRRAQFKNPF